MTYSKTTNRSYARHHIGLFPDLTLKTTTKEGMREYGRRYKRKARKEGKNQTWRYK